MSLPFSVLMCLFVAQLCVADLSVEEVITSIGLQTVTATLLWLGTVSQSVRVSHKSEEYFTVKGLFHLAERRACLVNGNCPQKLKEMLCCYADNQSSELKSAKPGNVRPLGGWTEKHPESADVQKAAQHAVEMFNSHSKAKKIFKLVAINSAKVQVTNGITYEVNMILGKTKCLRSENHDLQSCSLDQKRLNCTFQVRFNVHRNKYQSKNKRCKKVVMTA